jgi:hypothetical protein
LLRFSNIAEPLLYRDISLTNTQLAPFVTCAHTRRAPPNDGGVGAIRMHVRSLTITVDAVPPAPDAATPKNPYAYRKDEEQIEREGSAESKALWAHLCDLVALIAGGSSNGSGGGGGGMANLATFSLRVADRSFAKGFWLPRPLIALLVASLPAACVNLEVDTQGHDYAEPGAGGSGESGFAAGHHLCDTLRTVLPRLHQFRLRIKVLCPAAFVAGYRSVLATDDDDDDNGDDDNSGRFAGVTAVPAPVLITAVVNCVMQLPGYGGPARLCGMLAPENPTNFYWGRPTPKEARIPLARCLRWLATLPDAAASTSDSSSKAASSCTNGGGGSEDSSSSSSSGCFPVKERLWLLDMQLHDNSARRAPVYAAFNRRDIIANRSSTEPFTNVLGSDVVTSMMRILVVAAAAATAAGAR